MVGVQGTYSNKPSTFMGGRPPRAVPKLMAEFGRIIAVDDEVEILEMLAEYLGSQGLTIETCPDGTSLRAALEDQPADLVLLDINLPGEDGLSLVRWLKESSDSAVIMLTGADEVVDKVVGLELGADDYMAKPFDLRQLLARIKAVLRRRGAKGGTTENSDHVQIGDCQLDLAAHLLFDAEGDEIPITSMEYELLKAFAERPNRVLSRDQLFAIAHDRDWDPFDRSIDIRIARIRRKIESNPSKPQVIKTVRGVGYVFVPSHEQGSRQD